MRLARPITKPAWKIRLSTDVDQAELETSYGQRSTLNKDMELLRLNSSNYKIVKYREVNLNPSD